MERISVTGRYNQGVWIIDHNRLHETGPVVVARSVLPTDDVTFMTLNGVAMRTKVEDISQQGRSARGVRCVRLQEGDALVSAARVVEVEIKGEEPAGEVPAEGAPADAESANDSAAESATSEQVETEQVAGSEDEGS
jgi:DNA gyrase subunit A